MLYTNFKKLQKHQLLLFAIFLVFRQINKVFEMIFAASTAINWLKVKRLCVSVQPLYRYKMSPTVQAAEFFLFLVSVHQPILSVSRCAPGIDLLRRVCKHFHTHHNIIFYRRYCTECLHKNSFQNACFECASIGWTDLNSPCHTYHTPLVNLNESIDALLCLYWY